MNPSTRLSDRIADDLATRLTSTRPLPFQLNSLELARYYGSSRTPVNRALETLVSRGLLEKRPNGRLARTQPPSPIAPTTHLNNLGTDDGKTNHPATDHPGTIRPGTGTALPRSHTDPTAGDRQPWGETAASAGSQEEWRQSLRQQMVQEVVRLSLQGKANFLRENAWSERLGVGRGGLRLLLSELAGQGLVVHVPRRGWQVRPFDAGDMLQYLEIREVLELAALDLALGRLDPQRLHEMLAGNPTPELLSPAQPAPHQPPATVPVPATNALDQTDGTLPVPDSVSLPGPTPLNNEIHGYLVQQAGNRYIADFFHRHSNYYAQLFQMAAVETGWRDAMAQQHRQILTALLEQDWPSARTALAEHIRAQRPVVQDLLRQVRSSEEPVLGE